MSSNKLQVDTKVDNNVIASKGDDTRVLNFDENNTVSTGKDINAKISSLDTDLGQLRAELETINNSVEEGLDRLSDKDTDLTAKVSETYKRLGEIDRAYKALLEISSRIDTDIQKLNGDVSDVAEQSASGIKNLEQSTLNQSKEFAARNQQVVSRVNHLVETSKLTNEMMNQNIQSVTEKMLQIEKSIVSQIDSLSRATKDKAGEIEKSVDHNSANILKLQSVDEAISRRASELEVTTAELTARGQYLDSSVEQLQITTDVLASDTRVLKERTAALEEVSRHHGSLIDGLQKAGADMAGMLAALSGKESRHFRFVTVSLLLLLALSVAIYFSQQSQYSVNTTRIAESSEKITDVQQLQLASEAKTKDSLAIIESKIEQANFKLQTVQDQIQSVESRLNQSLPQSRFGNDNVIHGPQTITGLPEQNLTVQLAYVDDKNAMYEVAQRYRHRLNDTLYYFSVRDKGTENYVLLSGSYADNQQAYGALDSLPGYINGQKPVIRKLQTVQEYLAALN